MRMESRILSGICAGIFAGIFSLALAFPGYSQSASDMRTLLSAEGKVLYADEQNSIMVIDYSENIKTVGDYLQMIDENPRQVLIEARVVEVSLKGENSLGINWQAFAEKGGFKMGQFRVGSTANGALEQNFEYKPTYFPPGSTLASDREGPFAITIFDENINLVLNTLANNYDANILSAPRVTTVNNREAEIKIVTELRWVVPQMEVGDTGGVTITWAEADDSPRDVGISLKVTPMITDDDQISMELEPEVSEKTGEIELVASSGGTDLSYSIPIVDTRTAKTKVVIGNKQTLIIGGLIKNTTTKGVTKIPILGDIPVLGWLFKSSKDTKAKSELIIFVSPTIINQQEVMRMEKKEKEDVGKWYMRETEPQEDAQAQQPASKKKDTAKESLVTDKGPAAGTVSPRHNSERDIAVSAEEVFQPQAIIYKARVNNASEEARKVEKEMISEFKRKETRAE